MREVETSKIPKADHPVRTGPNERFDADGAPALPYYDTSIGGSTTGDAGWNS